MDPKTVLFQAADPQSMWNCTPFAHPPLTEQQVLLCGTLAQCSTCASLLGGSRWPSGWVREHRVSDNGENGRAGGRTSYFEVKPSEEEEKVEAERDHFFLSKSPPSSKFPSPLQSPETTLGPYCCPTTRAGSTRGKSPPFPTFHKELPLVSSPNCLSLLLVSKNMICTPLMPAWGSLAWHLHIL